MNKLTKLGSFWANKRLLTVNVLLAGAMSGCVTPPPPLQDAPVFDALNEAARVAVASNRILAASVVNQFPLAQQQKLTETASMQAPPNSDLARVMEFNSFGDPRKILKDIVESIGWHFAVLGNPDRDVMVQIVGSQSVFDAIRSISEQIQWDVVVSHKSRTVLLDYTRQATLDKAAMESLKEEKFFINLGKFPKKKASQIVTAFRKKKLRVLQVEDGTVSSIHVGPFPTEDAAESAKLKHKISGEVERK